MGTTGKKDSESDGRRPPQKEERWEVCAYCNGNGTDYDGRLSSPITRPCPNCDGLGVIYYD